MAACSKSEPAPTAEPAPLVPAPELKRGTDACKDYVTKVCACAEHVASLGPDCAAAKAIPDALEMSRQLANNPKADREDAVQAAGNVRLVIRRCIEHTAELATKGCP